jgi:hypothetical protein
MKCAPSSGVQRNQANCLLRTDDERLVQTFFVIPLATNCEDREVAIRIRMLGVYSRGLTIDTLPIVTPCNETEGLQVWADGDWPDR